MYLLPSRLTILRQNIRGIPTAEYISVQSPATKTCIPPAATHIQGQRCHQKCWDEPHMFRKDPDRPVLPSACPNRSFCTRLHFVYWWIVESLVYSRTRTSREHISFARAEIETKILMQIWYLFSVALGNCMVNGHFPQIVDIEHSCNAFLLPLCTVDQQQLVGSRLEAQIIQNKTNGCIFAILPALR